MDKKERKNRQHKKELKSFRNKMGDNLIWFDSLTNGQQYTLLLKWKEEKYYKSDISRGEIDARKLIKWGIHEIDHNFVINLDKSIFIRYPIKLKHFIRLYRSTSRFSVSKKSIRDTTIDSILDKK